MIVWGGSSGSGYEWRSGPADLLRDPYLALASTIDRDRAAACGF